MPVSPKQLLNDLTTPEIERAVKETVDYIDKELTKHFYGKPITVSHTPAHLPIHRGLFIRKIEQIYQQAGWKVKGKNHYDQRDGDWIEYKFEPDTSN